MYYRYPSPGSQPFDQTDNVEDFKTSYRDSQLNIRYAELYDKDELQIFSADPITETPVQKLIRTRYLEQNQQNDEQAIKEAKDQYEQANGKPLEQKIQFDQFQNESLNTFYESGFSRDSIQFMIRDQFESLKVNYETEDIHYNRDNIYKNNDWIISDNNVDMFAPDPVFRQIVMDNIFQHDQLMEEAKQRGYQQFFRGDQSFWRVLDNSFSPENIKSVQSIIGDQDPELNETQLAINHQQTEWLPQEKIELPIQSLYEKKWFKN